MSDPSSIHVHVGNDVSGVVNFGSIQGDLINGSATAKDDNKCVATPAPDKADSACSAKPILKPGPWRVFLSHTSELRDYPINGSYIDKAERAISASGHVIHDMADFPAMDQAPSSACVKRVRSCDVYVGIYGLRYGSLVRDQPEVSYTELEFDTATACGLPRLIFVIDAESQTLGLPAKTLIDRQYGDRQDAFLKRVMDSGITVQRFGSPEELKGLLERSLGALAEAHEVTLS